jgi:hypothetical protein
MDETTINYIIGILGILLAIIGIGTSYYFYRKSIRAKEPVFSIRSNNVISEYSSKYENLTVAYKGDKVENFTITKVLFFNKGVEAIYREDIATQNHLRIVTMNSDILDTRVLQANNLSNNFQVNLDRVTNSVFIDFEYLNTNQGAVVELIHNGTTSNNIVLLGDMKGVATVSKFHVNRIVTTRIRRNTRIIVFLGGVCMAIVVAGFIIWLFPGWKTIGILMFGSGGVGVAILALAAKLMGVLDVSVRPEAIPHGLEKFLE